MNSHTPIRTSLLLGSAVACILAGTAVPGIAATFDSEAVAPDLDVHVFDRGVAEEKLGRQLFSAPYASVVVGNVDVYDVFPYVESRYFVLVSDPDWDRLVVTATGSGKVSSFGGSGEVCGPLDGPRGLAVDEAGRVFVCDTENDRVLVLATAPEFDRLTLTPVGEIAGLSRPYGVAVSDAGTPFDLRDDRVYVAESGRNQVSRFVAGPSEAGASGTSAGSGSALRPDSGSVASSWNGPGTASVTFTRTGSIGGLGSGVGRFAGPMAIAVGREGDHSSDRIYVADAHNRRLVELVDDGHDLTWGREVAHESALVTGIETDRWGQVYAVSPGEGRVSKWSKDLEVLAVEESASLRPRGFHVPFVTTTDHRSGMRSRSAEGRGLLVEEWGTGTGVQAWSLGVDLHSLEPAEADPLAASFVLTDPARVEARLEDAQGSVLARRDLGLLTAGRQEVALGAEDLTNEPRAAGDGHARWVVEARSTYADRTPVVATAETWVGDDARFGGGTASFEGSFPNPFLDATSLRLVLPAGTTGQAEADIFDLSGRRVRALVEGHDGGSADLVWDGRDDRGNELGSGVYFYRVRAAGQEWQGRVVRIQ